MKTELIEGRHYTALSRWRGTRDYFCVGSSSHGGACTFLSFPPAEGSAIGRGGYHWTHIPGMTDYSLVKEDTIVEMTKEELLQVIQDTGWRTISREFEIDNWNGQLKRN